MRTNGIQGAATIAPVLLDLYGKNGFAFIIDEGGKLTASELVRFS
jgi:hypothetical protein